MTTVSSRPSLESLPACLPDDAPEPRASTKATAPPSASVPPRATATGRAERPARLAVEPYREDDVPPGAPGARLERTYLQALEQVPPGGKLVLHLEALLRLKVAGELRARIEVDRAPDGSYQLTLRGALGAGLAAPPVRAPPVSGEGAGARSATGSALAGLHGAVTLRFASAAEAADRLAALTQASALASAGIPIPLAAWAGVVEGDLPARSSAALTNLASFEGGLHEQLKGELESGIARLGGSLLGELTYRVDVREGKLRFEGLLQLQAQGQAHTPFRDTARRRAPLDFLTSVGGAGLETRALLRKELALTAGELQALREGRLDPASLLRPERLKSTVMQEVKGELAGATFSARRELPLESLEDAAALLTPAGDWEVEAGLKVSHGGKWKADLAALHLETSATLERPLFTRGPRRLPLERLAPELHQALEAVRGEEHLLAARLAASRR